MDIPTREHCNVNGNTAGLGSCDVENNINGIPVNGGSAKNDQPLWVAFLAAHGLMHLNSAEMHSQIR